MIDIVVPYYNDNDDYWRKMMEKYMIEEGSSDRQVIGEERYRDWDCFKYFFRCIEKNCKWANKIFLILANETQIPDWLDTNNPKLRIVYHREYIPKDLLPTFNTMTIEVFISRIKDLSDNYIYCNDDYFFLNPISEKLFFIDNYPVYRENKSNLIKFNDNVLNGSDGTFYKTLNNGMEFQLKVVGEKANWYSIDHLPVAHKKEFENEIIEKYYKDFIRANSVSRFRSVANLTNHVFVCLYKDLKPYYKFNNYYNSCYVTIRPDTNFNAYEKCDMVCFNDTEQISKEDFKAIKEKMVSFFEKKYPDKCSFEK